MKKMILLALCMGFSACSTIHFKNGNTGGMATGEEWHHIGILNLVEFSPPVELASRCEGRDWNYVTTETGVLQGIVKAFVGGFYGPERVEISCKK